MKILRISLKSLPNADLFPTMKTGLLIALMFITALSAHAGYTYRLTSPSQDDFEDCYYRGKVGGVFVKNVEPGDTIVLPSGSATWGAYNRGNNGKIWLYNIGNIVVRGQGDSTVITLDETGASVANGVINILQSGVVWGWMKILSAKDNEVGCFIVGASGTRLTHITYEGQPPSDPKSGKNGSGYFLFQQGVTGTLIDHCTITGVVGNHEWIFTRGPADAWQTNSPIGTSQQDVFVEDCTFNTMGYSDANSNARHVFRFNTINGNIKLDGHGVASNSPARSFRSVEYYNNTWTSSAMSFAAAIEIRGGTAMVFNNSSTTGLIFLRDYAYSSAWPNFGHFSIAISGGTPTTITTNEPHGYQTGWPIYVDCFAQNIVGYYPVTVTSPTTFTVIRPEATNGVGWNIRRFFTAFDYPIFDQIGTGKDGGPREPAYLWGNTQGGSAWVRTVSSPDSGAQTLYKAQTGNPSATFTERDVIAANRDFFASAGFDSATGVSTGTRAMMNALTPPVVGYGFWVTDEGSWNTRLPPNTSGRLYKWNGSTWVLHYTPYTYPHPLQTAIVCDTPTPSVSSGTYEYAQSVTLATTPSDSTIRYTTNGTDPDHTNGTLYSGAISVTGNTTIKAMAYKTGLDDSPIMEAAYVITGQVFTPTSNKATANYHGDQLVTLACATTGAKIHYTLDGSTPTSSSPIYTGPLTVVSTTTIKAIALKSGLTDSTVLTVGITILLEVGHWDDSVGSLTDAYTTAERKGLAYFTAPVSGNLTRISIFGTNSSATLNVQFGLYEDPTGSLAYPSALIRIGNSPTTFNSVGMWTNSWRDFDVSFPVTAGHKYWIIVGVSEASLKIKGSYPGGYRWNNYTSYGDPWPSQNNFNGNFDGWALNVKGMITETGKPTQQSPNRAPTVQINMTVEPPK